MRIGLQLNYTDGFVDAAEEVRRMERVGLDAAFVPEAYSFDAVSRLGYLAARTERVELASGILQSFSRTPTLTAMSAAGLDEVSGGRFSLGIGPSGPQVVEGFHGVAYDHPLARTRELVEICRKVWRREVVRHDGRFYQLPLPEGRGTGLGKPLKLINHPLRERIPIIIAALGPKNVEMTAEIAEGWQPTLFSPDKFGAVWGDALAAGAAKRDASLPPLDIIAGAPLAIGDDVQRRLDFVRPYQALYIGGMGARGKNFYNEMACRYGFEAEARHIQDLYLDGKKEEAAAAVPEDLLHTTSLVGPAGWVKERLAAYAEAGVTTLLVNPLAADADERVEMVRRLRELAD